MSDKGGFESNQPVRRESEGSAFHDQLVRAESGERSSLQFLSPDKRVYEVGNLSTLNGSDKALLQQSLVQAVEQWSKVVEPLRNVFNNWKRQEMNGDPNGNGERYAKNYMAKIAEVLRDNMAHLSDEIPFRVAVPVQSFVPGPDGTMRAETLHAFFPPKQTDVQERYITMPLHSDDPAREAQLRKDPSLANSISSHELEFRLKVGNLLARRVREVEA